MYRQYDLRSDDARLTAWLDDASLRVGTLVVLRGDEHERWWEVVRRHDPVLSQPPEKRWRVGGLL